jgi:hypothetical protein
MRSRWNEVSAWERETGHTHPDHDIELRRDERRKTTLSFLFLIGGCLFGWIAYGGFSG